MTVKYEFKEHLIETQYKNETAMLKELDRGNYTMENPLIKYNPYVVNALSAVILFETEEEVGMVVRVKGKTPEADFYQAFPKAKRHVLPIVGLYSDYENKIEIHPWQKPDQVVTHTIKTPKTPNSDLVHSMETTAEYMQDNLMILSCATSDFVIGVDNQGDVRLEFTVPILWDIKHLDNGNILVGSDRLIKMPYFVSGMYEMSLVGKIYKEYRVPRGYHHDQCVLPNGDIVALNCDWDNATVEDQAVLIDKDTGAVKKVWNFRDFIKPGSQKSGSWSDEDWFHCNAVWYDEQTNSLTFSGRHINSMVNIDFDSGELNWIISDPEMWAEEYQKYMFTPVGDGDFGWQYEQHSNLITPLGDVMCFDNHHWGSQNPDKYLAAKDNYSRGVKYRIDTDKKEIEQVWQYGKERGHEFFSPYICNVKYYNEGHYLTHSGGITYTADGEPSEELGPFAQLDDPNADLRSITVETIGEDKMLELKVKSNYYRANKYPAYNTYGNNLALGRGKLVGDIGETLQMDYDIPAEDTGELLPDTHEGRLVEEADMFTFHAKFAKGQLVMLLLEGEEETRRYFISTAKGKRGAMCAGTFLSADDRDTRTGVTKEGMKGAYKVKVIVDDKKYDTGLTIHA
ncbi:aryl-sulfate sulfotransferase [Aerococcus urinae]|uniref:aryl-sulfate sulfotransferase n=1 Tax=Aerococcus urinae TaxID=1376 RepID=UPI000DCD449A|nr:aryl sulfotransferase [Aerococcus urinae]